MGTIQNNVHEQYFRPRQLLTAEFSESSSKRKSWGDLDSKPPLCTYILCCDSNKLSSAPVSRNLALFTTTTTATTIITGHTAGKETLSC